MCTGNAATPLIAAGNLQRQTNQRERQQKKQQEKRQAELDAIAARREAATAANRDEMRSLRQQSREQSRQDARAQGSAVVQSARARAVAGQNSGPQAPGAALTVRKSRRGRQGNAASSLRIGPASTGSGAGPNVAV